MSHLDGMPQDVLPVARPVSQPAQQLYQLRMYAVYARFKQGLIPGLADLVIDLPTGLFHHFLDARGMYAPIHDQLLQRDAGNLPANRVEPG